MDKTFKGGNVLWIVLTTVSLLCAAGLLFLMFQERDNRIATEQKLSASEKAKRTVEIKLDHAQSELIQLKDEARLLAKNLEEEKRNHKITLAGLDKKDAQIKQLDIDLANEKKQRTSLANTLAQLRERRDSLETELADAKLKVEEFRSQLGKLRGEAGVELKKIVVKPKKKLSGKVLVVNREFHFIVIDLGKKDGVRIGDEFAVYQGAQEIAKAKVEKTYDVMSTAVILSGSQEQLISEDNTVKSF